MKIEEIEKSFEQMRKERERKERLAALPEYEKLEMHNEQVREAEEINSAIERRTNKFNILDKKSISKFVEKVRQDLVDAKINMDQSIKQVRFINNVLTTYEVENKLDEVMDYLINGIPCFATGRTHESKRNQRLDVLKENLPKVIENTVVVVDKEHEALQKAMLGEIDFYEVENVATSLAFQYINKKLQK